MQSTAIENSEILIYENQDGNIKIDVLLEENTVWLTQAQMALLFAKGRTTITEHIQNIFSEGELDENSVCRNSRLTAGDGKNYRTNYYNLDAMFFACGIVYPAGMGKGLSLFRNMAGSAAAIMNVVTLLLVTIVSFFQVLLVPKH